MDVRCANQINGTAATKFQIEAAETNEERAGFFAASCKAYFKGEIYAEAMPIVESKDLMSKYGPRKPGSSSSALNVRLSNTYDMCAAQPERCQS